MCPFAKDERQEINRSSEGETLGRRFEISAGFKCGGERGRRDSVEESSKRGREGKMGQHDQPIYRVNRKTREKAKETDFQGSNQRRAG